MDFLKEYYRKALIEKINTKTENKMPLDAGVEDILPMMKYLAEKSESPEIGAWIPLEYKRLLFYIIYGSNGRIHTEITDYTPNGSCEATCSIYIRENGTEYLLTDAVKYRTNQNAKPFVSITAEERNALMKSYAMAAAERTALYKAGICMDFSGDIDDEKPEDTDPTSPLTPEQKKAMENVADVLKEEASEIDLASNLAAPSSNNTSETNSNETITDLDTVLFGTKKGQPISQMEPKYLAWMLYEISRGHETVDEPYKAKVEAMVNENAAALAIYNKEMAKKTA